MKPLHQMLAEVRDAFGADVIVAELGCGEQAEFGSAVEAADYARQLDMCRFTFRMPSGDYRGMLFWIEQNDGDERLADMSESVATVLGL